MAPARWTTSAKPSYDASAGRHSGGTGPCWVQKNFSPSTETGEGQRGHEASRATIRGYSAFQRTTTGCSRW